MPKAHERVFAHAAHRLAIPIVEQNFILGLLQPFRDGITAPHYTHSLRVGVMLADIALITHQPARVLFIAGTLHDVGKSCVDSYILGKRAGWTTDDAKEMQRHVIEGYRILNTHAYYTEAEILVRHHLFQADPYPQVLPASSLAYCNAQKLNFLKWAKLLALTDVYDAMRFRGDRYCGLSDEARKNELKRLYPEDTRIIERLYEVNIFT